MPTPLPAIMPADYAPTLNAYRTGQQDRIAQDERNTLKQAGGLAAAGNMKGATSALYAGGNFDQASKFQAEQRAAQSHAQAMTNDQLAHSAQAHELLGRLAGTITTPDQLNQAKQLLKSRGLNADHVTMDQLPMLAQQSISVGDAIKNEMEERKLGILTLKATKERQEEFGTTPQYYKDESGNLQVGQLSKSGGMKPVQVPGKVLPGLDYRDLGTTVEGRDKRTGEVITSTPKDVSGESQAKELGTATGKQIADQPQAIFRTGTAISNLDRLEQEARAIRDHSGLESNFGMTGMVPNRPGSQASNANARLSTLKSQIANNVLQAMRESSKTGGALGSVSDAEQTLLQNNIAALDKAQSYPEIKKALDRIIEYAQGSKQRINRVYHDTYGRDYINQQGGAEQGGNAPSGIKNDPLGILE